MKAKSAMGAGRGRTTRLKACSRSWHADSGRWMKHWTRASSASRSVQATPANIIPVRLGTMPPIALWSAMENIRRLMCMNSSTFLREFSIATTSADSAVTSLFCPTAMPTVAARNSEGSSGPSPPKTPPEGFFPEDFRCMFPRNFGSARRNQTHRPATSEG